MSSTPEVVEAHLDRIHLTATKTEALTDANKPATLKKLDIPDTIELRELKYLNNAKGLTQFSPGFRTVKATLEIDVVKDSAVLTMLRTKYAAREPFFLHLIENATAPVGSQGWVYECVLGSFPATREAGALRSLSLEIGVNDFAAI